MSGKVSPRIFEPGSLCTPLRGAVRWEGSRALGVWGDASNPVSLHVCERDGTIRRATRAERRLARRIWPGLGEGGAE
ncbi:MAG: hypothetical protein ACQEUZ_09885 [Pseudomonadota bacterium]